MTPRQPTPELPTPELPTPELPTPELPTPALPTPELSTRLPLGQFAQRSAQVVDAAVVEAARVLLAQMGVTVDDLLNAAPARPPCPTFTEYVPRVAA